jgi:hypothetical protein
MTWLTRSAATDLDFQFAENSQHIQRRDRFQCGLSVVRNPSPHGQAMHANGGESIAASSNLNGL